MSVSEPTTVLNTIVADALRGFAERIEGARDIQAEIKAIIKETVLEHGRIVFNGNNYSAEWRDEAVKRGLPDYKNTAEALPHLTDPKNIGVFVRNGVFTESELKSRREIYLDNYCKTVSIEALTALDMARQQILPSIAAYIAKLSEAERGLSAISVEAPMAEDMKKLSSLYQSGKERVANLESALFKARARGSGQAAAILYAEEVLPAMLGLRVVADEAELMVSEDCWQYPKYDKLLFDI